MWNPSNSALIKAWLSFRELYDHGLVSINPSPNANKALRRYDRSEFRNVMGKSHFGTQIYNFVIANPRAFLIAYNSNMDFMAKEDGCINPETFVTILAEHRNIESEKLFNQASMDEAVQLLHQTTELEDRMFSETQNAGRNSGAGIGHVTIEHTKKGIKVQQVVTVLVALVGLALAILGNPTQSNTGVIICVVSVVWLLAAIPLQKWWHHG